MSFFSRSQKYNVYSLLRKILSLFKLNRRHLGLEGRENAGISRFFPIFAPYVALMQLIIKIKIKL